MEKSALGISADYWGINRPWQHTIDLNTFPANSAAILSVNRNKAAFEALYAPIFAPPFKPPRANRDDFAVALLNQVRHQSLGEIQECFHINIQHLLPGFG